jgi:hypothetical protein
MELKENLSAGDRRKNGDLVARSDRRIGGREIVIHGDAHRAPRRELDRPGSSALRKPSAQRSDGRDFCRRLDAFGCRAESLA